MKVLHGQRSILRATVCLCWLLVSAGCALVPGTDVTKTATPPAVQTPVAPVTQRMPATDTTCPTNGTARPAIMKTLVPGTSSSLVYLDNASGPTVARLKIYNLHTKQRTLLLQLADTTIIHAQISADGQWVLFLARGTDSILKLQLIRMDGQGLQTLYCLPAADYTYNNPSSILASALWSPDQRSVLISSFANRATSTISLLDLRTGALKTELSLTDGPEVAYTYSALKWLDNTKVYITRTAFGAPTPPGILYVLDVHKNRDTQGGGLKTVLQYQRRFAFSSLDSSQDGRELFASACLTVARPFETLLTVQPSTGGQQQTIYKQSPSTCIHEMRAISKKSLLLFMEIFNGSISYDHQIWKLALDTHKYSVLVDTQTSEYAMNRFTQNSWSNLSRDGQFYALGPNHYTAAPQQVAIGPLSGGALTIFDSATVDSLDIVGWTTS